MSCPQIDFARAKDKKQKKRKAKGLQVGESLAPVQLGTEGPLIRGALSHAAEEGCGYLQWKPAWRGGLGDAGALEKPRRPLQAGSTAPAAAWHTQVLPAC